MQNVDCIVTETRQTIMHYGRLYQSQPGTHPVCICRRKWDMETPELQRPSRTSAVSWTPKLALTQNEIFHVTTKVRFIILKRKKM